MEDVILLGTVYRSKMGEERKGLRRELEKEGLEVRTVPWSWPRDRFVNQKGRISLQSDYDTYAEGGYILNAPDFLIASCHIGYEYRLQPISRELIRSTLKEMYQVETVVLVGFPPDPVSVRYRYGHVDRYVLAIPERKLLVIDETVASSTHYQELFDFAHLRGLKIETYPEFCLFSNSLFVETESKSLLFSPVVRDDSIVKRLSHYDIEVRQVPFAWNIDGDSDGDTIAVGGGIRCATNLFPKKDVEFIDTLLKLNQPQE